MAKARKPGASRSKAPKGAKKTPVKSAKRVAKPAKASKAKPAAKTVKPAVVAKGGKAVAKVAAKGAPAGKNAKGRPLKPVIKVVQAKPTPQVRPIGVLPPEAVARSHRAAAVVLPERPTPKPARDASGGHGAQGVSEKDYKEFEERLLGERQKILKEMGHLENTVLKINQRDSAGDLSGYSFHMADVGTDAMEREKAFLFASAEGRLLVEINEALRRVYRGEYGKCEECEKPIARARLEAMPYARFCVSCKEKQERAARGAS